MNKIFEWGKAIQAGEGWYVKSRSYRNKNPGNLRFANQKGNIGKDKDGFVIFPDEDTGFAALCHQLTIACDGRSKIYSPSDSLYDFFEKFSPSSDNNHPREYAERVATKLKINPEDPISQLL